jgi:hypothetical protein
LISIGRATSSLIVLLFFSSIMSSGSSGPPDGRSHNQRHMHAQAPAFQPQQQPPPQQPPQYYGHGQQQQPPQYYAHQYAPTPAGPPGYGHGGGGGGGGGYYQQHPHQQQQYGLYGSPQHANGAGGGGGGGGYPTHYHQHDPQQQQQQQQPAPPAMDPAALEAEIRRVVESALSTRSLLRGAAAAAGGSGSGGGGGGYNYHNHKQHKKQQAAAAASLLRKVTGGCVPFDAVCALPPVKRLAQGDRALVQRALEASETLVVAGNGKQQRVGRKDMAAGTPGVDLPYRCVVLTRLAPEKASEAAVRALVAPYGVAACVVVVGAGGEGEKEATAAGRGPPLEVKAVVEFAEGKGAVKVGGVMWCGCCGCMGGLWVWVVVFEIKKNPILTPPLYAKNSTTTQCVEALSGGSDWRRGTRAEFVVANFSLEQAAKHFQVPLSSGGGETGGGGEAGAATATSAGASLSSAAAAAASAMPASVLEARLPPTFREGEHTGVVMELELALVTGPATEAAAAAAAATGATGATGEGKEGGNGAASVAATGERQVQRGVIKREGRVRSQISFELPAADVGEGIAVGHRVDFVVKHVANKAVVVSLRPSTAPLPAAPLRSLKKEAAHSSPAFVQAKGPDERGGVGFLLPRTKPGEEMQGMLLTLKQLKVGSSTAGKSG